MGFGRALLLVGPTASGKTSLALRLAERTPAEIVNADALQAVAGLDVGTGKPTAEERSRVPHHLFDVVGPETRFSAGDYARRARPVVEAVLDRGRLPIVVGGSGFYLAALVDGLAELPPPDPEIRRVLRRRWDAEGGEHESWRELVAEDAETAARLEPRDRQRVLRALEILRQTGRPMSTWLRENPPRPAGFASVWAGLDVPAAELRRRIARRVRTMVEAGWLEEVRGLLASGVPPEAPGFQALGYRQMVRVVHGDIDLETAIEETVRATRRYAKRQRTWFRRRSEITPLRAEPADGAVEQALDLLRSAG